MPYSPDGVSPSFVRYQKQVVAADVIVIPRSCSCSTFALVQRSAARHFRLTTWLCQHHGTTRLWTKARTQCARSSTISIRSGCANRSSKVVPGLQPQTNSFCKRMLHGTHAVVLGWGVCGACRILDAAFSATVFPLWSAFCSKRSMLLWLAASTKSTASGARWGWHAATGIAMSRC